MEPTDFRMVILSLCLSCYEESIENWSLRCYLGSSYKTIAHIKDYIFFFGNFKDLLKACNVENQYTYNLVKFHFTDP